MSRLYAIVLLGWHFLIHYLKKLTLLYDPGGLEQFRENFASEGLASLDDQERELLADWQRCIGCGLCEAACPELSTIPENRHKGPRYIALGAGRDLSEAELAIPTARAVETCQEDLREICPVDIPLADLAAFLERMAKREERRLE
jgi:succinate dehydrogenase/fumarate reductase-like Fe-S protein